MTRSTKGLFLAIPALAFLLTGAALSELPANTVDAGERSSYTPADLTPSRALHGAVLHQSDGLAMPLVLAVAGDRLILADDYADRHIRVLRRGDGTVERSFGRTGRGPREFETIYSIDVVDPTGELLIHDPTLQRVTRVSLGDDFDGDRWVGDRSFRLNANAMLIATMWSPGGLLGIGAVQGGRRRSLENVR